MIAVRDNDLAAEVMGVKLFQAKATAFILCSVYAGIGGALFAYSSRGLSADAFTLWDSILYVGMLVVGGLGSVMGVCQDVI